MYRKKLNKIFSRKGTKEKFKKKKRENEEYRKYEKTVKRQKFIETKRSEE
jgi:hypothetical protein